MTVKHAYNHITDQLKTIYEPREAQSITDWVFESIAGIKRLDWLLKQHEEIDTQKLFEALDELLTHKPVQYVLGEAWFYKMKFRVNEFVLIPRPETEELVEDVRIGELEDGRMKNISILDIGTGTGCIAIALNKNVLGSTVTGIDISEEALNVAKENSIELGADIEFIQLDFLNKNEWRRLAKFDVIVSNPPYIPANEKEKLEKNVTEFEPHLALFVADNDPFIFYRRIAEFAKDHLQIDGKLFVEIHEDYATEVSSIFKSCNFKTEIKKDMYGRDRIVKAG